MSWTVALNALEIIAGGAGDCDSYGLAVIARIALNEIRRAPMHRLDLTDDELRAVYDRLRSAYAEHDPGDVESHKFWTGLLMKVEQAARLSGFKL